MNYHILFFISLGVLRSQCKEEDECLVRKLRECSLKYKTSLPFYPINSEQLRQYCSAGQLNEDCFRNAWTECIPKKSDKDIVTERMNEFDSPHFKDLCNFNSTYSRLFVMYGKCLSQTVLEQRKCQNKYKLMTKTKDEVLNAIGFSRNNTRAENTQKIRQLCCWWVEYQFCTVKSVLDRCGEMAAILVNEEFYKSFTSSATAKILTYKACLPQDKTFRYPTCFLNNSIDPNSLGLTLDSNELDFEDESRKTDLMEMIGLKAIDNNVMDFSRIDASTSGARHINTIITLYLSVISLIFYVY